MRILVVRSIARERPCTRGDDAAASRASTCHDGDTFTYNAERNQLLSANLSGTLQLDYAYDAAGYVTSRAGVPITWEASGKVASMEWRQGVRLPSRFMRLTSIDSSGGPARLTLAQPPNP